tara:strand:- start:304 stop:1032 length:729 start_codon:yes stop_codon:yes gene_type:complete
MEETVKKPHSFITSKMRLTAREQDLLTLAVKKIKLSSDQYFFKHQKNVTKETIKTAFSFTTQELSQLFHVTPSALYHTLDEVTDSLINKPIFLKNPDMQEFEKIVLFSNIKYRCGVLTLEVSQSTALMMLDYSKGFGEIDLKILLKLNGGYEKRILDLISRFKNKREFQCSIDELAEMLGTQRDNYKLFSNFRRVVIERPLQNIIQKSNGVWTAKKDFPKGYHLIKKGRHCSGIIFKMHYNK